MAGVRAIQKEKSKKKYNIMKYNYENIYQIYVKDS